MRPAGHIWTVDNYQTCSCKRLSSPLVRFLRWGLLLAPASLTAMSSAISVPDKGKDVRAAYDSIQLMLTFYAPRGHARSASALRGVRCEISQNYARLENLASIFAVYSTNINL